MILELLLELDQCVIVISHLLSHLLGLERLFLFCDFQLLSQLRQLVIKTITVFHLRLQLCLIDLQTLYLVFQRLLVKLQLLDLPLVIDLESFDPNLKFFDGSILRMLLLARFSL